VTRNEAERRAGEYLAGKRLEHSFSVARLASRMGEVLAFPECDVEALYIAGALHDIAKQFDDEKQYDLAGRWYAAADTLSVSQSHSESVSSPVACGSMLQSGTTSLMVQNSALWHAPAAAWIIRYELGIPDHRIAHAAARHTTGCRGMTRFEECLYAADFLDPCRPFAEQASVWRLLERDFDEALLAMCRGSIEGVLANRQLLGAASLEYYNELIERLSRPDRRVDAVCIRRENGE
jgi:HD superfamily phosphohydrolase YqeK